MNQISSNFYYNNYTKSHSWLILLEQCKNNFIENFSDNTGESPLKIQEKLPWEKLDWIQRRVPLDGASLLCPQQENWKLVAINLYSGLLYHLSTQSNNPRKIYLWKEEKVRDFYGINSSYYWKTTKASKL